MTPTQILNSLKSEALANAVRAPEQHMHYNSHKSIQGRCGYADHENLQCVFTIYASGRTRCTFNAGFLKMNYNEAIQWLKENTSHHSPRHGIDADGNPTK